MKEQNFDEKPFVNKKDIMVYIEKKPYMKETGLDLDDFCEMDYSYPKKTMQPEYLEHMPSFCSAPMKDMYPSYDYYKKTKYVEKEYIYHDKNQDFIKELQFCSGTCYKMMNDLLDSEDYYRRSKQIRLLHECAKICDSQAIFTLIDSHYVKHHAKLCAAICETCAEECSKHADLASQHCAKVCLNCAESCRKFIKM